MKFLKQTKTVTEAAPSTTTCDNVEDPKILSHQLLNTKKSFRIKKFTHIRISEIGTFCPREYAIGYHTDTAQESYVDLPLQQQFDLGTAIHDFYQNHSKRFREILYGYWECLACRNLRKISSQSNEPFFGIKPKTNCETCNAYPEATKYYEFFFRSDEPYRVVGKMDGLFFKDGVYRFGDFKSYVEAPKGGLPIGKDISQLASYMYFYNLLPESAKFPVPVDTSRGYLFYISKKFSYSESILTYPLEPTQKMIDLILERVSLFTNSVQTKEIPQPFEPCIRGKFSVGKAKACNFKDICKQWYDEGKVHA